MVVRLQRQGPAVLEGEAIEALVNDLSLHDQREVRKFYDFLVSVGHTRDPVWSYREVYGPAHPEELGRWESEGGRVTDPSP